MKDHPKAIEKRFFTCQNCGYNTQVYGEMYYDYGCYNYMGTFFCKKCQIIFEGIITKANGWRIYDELTHHLGEQPVCLKCGYDRCTIWNKDSGKCPKCGGKMTYTINGKIKLWTYD